jgi:uridylate kinase
MKKRILIKISGKSLSGEKESIHDIKMLDYISINIKKLLEDDYTISIVIGGGNIYRGSSKEISVPRVQADHIGMLATIINGIMILENMKKHDIDSRLMSSISIEQICESYSYNKALKYLDDKKVLIFVGGTGNPFCTTDSAAILKAIETGSQLVLKATNVDGVYSDNPKTNPNAKRFNTISYDEIIKQNLKIMDIGSILMAKEFNMPIKIFNIGDDFSDIINNVGQHTFISKG